LIVVFVPQNFFFDHFVDDGDKLSHGGDEGDEFWFSGEDESVVEGFDFRVVEFGDDRGQVECGSNVGSAAAGGSFSSESSAVPVSPREFEEAGDSDEPCDLLSVECSQFGQLGDENSERHRSDAGDRSQNSGASLHEIIALNDRIDFGFERLHLLLKQLDHFVDHAFYVFVVSASTSVLFSDDVCRELSSSGRQIFEFLLCFTERISDSRLHALGKQSNDPSINGVGFRELSCGPGEVTNLSWIDDGDFELPAEKSLHERSFESARRFQTNSFGASFFEQFQKLAMPQPIIGDGDKFFIGCDKDIEFVFGDIDADAIVEQKFRTRLREFLNHWC